MRKLIFGVTALAVAVALVASASVVAKPHKSLSDMGPIGSGSTQDLNRSAGAIESTGFEAADGWIAGAELCGGPANGFCTIAPPFADQCPAAGTNCCVGDPHPQTLWFRSGSDQHCSQPHIETAHPASGTQHLRWQFAADGGNPLGCAGVNNTMCRVTAFTPDMGPQVIGPYRTEFDIAFPNYNNGVTWQYFNVTGGGTIEVYMLFYFDGTIHLFDYSTTPSTPVYHPFDTTGAYGHVDVFVDPCHPTDPGSFTYSYNNVVALSNTFAQAGVHGSNQRAILAGDNGLDTVDVDNYLITRMGACPAVCGNGILEPGETCDGNNPAGQCPDRCDQNCTCPPICTEVDPCVLVNGDNGPFRTPCSPQFGCIFIYQADTEVVSIDTCGSTFDTFIFWFSANDLADPGAANDDCCDPNNPNCGASFGAGSDPSASCYDPVNFNLDSCTCHDLPMPGDDVFLAQIVRSGPALPPPGQDLFVHIDKKQTCGVEWLNGACCDSNGVTGGDPAGCVDDVAQADCMGPDDTWYENKFCDTVTCDCIPDCSGAECGDDGCGGSCGTCDDSLVCTDDACVGRTCEFTPVVCDDGVACTDDACTEPNGCSSTPNDANCDDGLFCTGTETCSGAGCSSSGNPCPEGTTCNEDTDTCDSAVIPTVSEWGLVVMALLLLAGAKVYFGRREVIA
jgi:hypothetical protein